VAERVKAPFLRQPCDHDRAIYVQLSLSLDTLLRHWIRRFTKVRGQSHRSKQLLQMWGNFGKCQLQHRVGAGAAINERVLGEFWRGPRESG